MSSQSTGQPHTQPGLGHLEAQLPIADAAAVRAAVIRDLRADRGSVVWIILVNGLASAAGLVGPWLLGRIIDILRAQPANVLGTVDRLALAALLVTAVQTVFSWWALRTGYRFGERTAARVRERFLYRALALSSRVIDRAPAGDLIARGSTDSSTVANTLRFAVPQILVAVVQALFLIVAVLVLDFRLGLCGVACLVGVGAAVRWYSHRARPAYLAVAATGAQNADVIASTAQGARTIELLGLEDRRAQAAEAAISQARSARLWALWLRTILFTWSEISLVVPVVGVLLVGGALYLHDLTSLGIVVTATVYLRQLVDPVNTLMLWIEQFQGAGASYARLEGVANVHDAEPLITTHPQSGRQDPGDRILVDSAHYGYTEGHEVLHGINLHVQPGERLAIVGTSGAGKSTLARLLAGLDRPDSGTVTVGSTPVADLPPDQLREHVVLITQEHHVFHDSVRDNLLIAKPNATDHDLHAALSAVGATWISDLPDGLDTEIGNDLTLDDAQAQQLSLARVVLADPHTLILDEATSLLDPRTARRTEQSLAAVLHGRTVIAIAHRLQTAHDADRIAVIEDGQLVELGAHDQLVAHDHTYGELWRRWQAEAAHPNTRSPT